MIWLCGGQQRSKLTVQQSATSTDATRLGRDFGNASNTSLPCGTSLLGTRQGSSLGSEDFAGR